MIILGIDPGYDRMGWGIIDRATNTTTYVACGILQTQKTDTYLSRLLTICSDLHALLEQFHPDIIVIESLFFATNKKTAIDVAQARGAILLTCAKSGVQVQEYTPLQIKSRVTGDGRADKKAVEKMVRLQLSGVPERLLDDTLDALACALASSQSAF